MIVPAWISNGSPIPDPLGLGECAVQWLRKIPHPKNRKRSLLCAEWQERIVRAIYGPRHPDGTRVVRRVFMLLPRGARKTSLAAAITLLELACPDIRVPGGLITSAASAKDQAKELFKEAALIVSHDRTLSRHLKIKRGVSSIELQKAATEYRAISADGGVAHGKTPSVVIADELHVWRKQHRDLWEALTSSLVKTPNTLLIVATTAGRGQENLAWEQYAYALKVQRGEIIDPATLPVIFAAEAGDDWRDEALWHAVNPGLAHGFPDLAGMRDLARKAENSPSDRDAFCQFTLNLWLDRSTSGFVDMATYDRGSDPIDLATLAGRPCWVAVDMSATTDLTAVVAAFPDEAGGYIVLPLFFCPADNLRARADRDGVPYPRWAQEGHITPTPGNVVDPRAVEQAIRDLCERFRVQQISFDPAYAQPVMGPLNDNGFPVVTMRQGWVTQSPALNVLERAIVSGQFRHGGHPVLRWSFENVAINTDSAGNRTMHKGKSTDRIDGAVAAWMAVGSAALGASSRSIFADPDITFEDLVL